jgi:pimeloyl-ACP methyl ester carboxylesterase
VKVFLSDGRALRYWSSATPGPVVLFFHGCPDTRRIAMTGEEAAHEAGVRLLCVNRPGYGVATAAASTHTSVARDATELLDLWGIEEVAVLGMSVGGPYAAAFASTYPDRVTALGLVASPAMTETAEDTVEEAMGRLRPGFEVWRAKIDPDDEDDEALAARFLTDLPEADAALLGERGTEFVAGVVWEALRQPEGYLRDAALLFREWDFRVGDVACPATLWVGEADEKAMAAVPWWTERLPAAELRVAPRTSHLATLLRQWPEILTTVSGRAPGSG